MLVQKFIREKGLNELKKDPFYINIKEYPNEGLVVLNYDLLNSKKYNPIVKECRGLILDSKNNYNIVAKSFDKFYNYRECPDTHLYDFKDCIVQEKIDGTLCTVYFHNNKWNVATRKMAFAEGKNNSNKTFRETFNKAFDLKKIKNFDKNLNFVFELVSPESRIVTRYMKFEVYLLTIINKGIECPDYLVKKISEELKIKRPKTYKVNTINDINIMIRKLPPLEEGYVCIWNNYNSYYRLKIKNPSYLAIAHLRDNGKISEKSLINLILKGDEQEYLNYFPEDIIIFKPYINALIELKKHIKKLWVQFRNIKDQKEFALKIKDYPVKSILFSFRKGLNIKDIFEKLTINSKIQLINFYKKEN